MAETFFIQGTSNSASSPLFWLGLCRGFISFWGSKTIAAVWNPDLSYWPNLQMTMFPHNGVYSRCTIFHLSKILREPFVFWIYPCFFPTPSGRNVPEGLYLDPELIAISIPHSHQTHCLSASFPLKLLILLICCITNTTQKRGEAQRCFSLLKRKLDNSGELE